jgi:hypothetical protein
MTDQQVAPVPMNEFVVEVRFKLKSKPIYNLQQIAERAAEHMELPVWKVRLRRIEVADESQRWLGFASDYHAGFVGRGCISAEEFAEKAAKFLRFMFKHDPFGDNLLVEHIGVKTGIAETYTGKYNELNDRFKKRMFAKLEGGKTVLSSTLSVEHERTIPGVDGRIKFNGGPVKKKKISQLFRYLKEAPEQALYLEFDYFITPKAEVKTYQVYTTVRAFCQQEYTWYEKIKQIVLG